jgi:hypothetical protein
VQAGETIDRRSRIAAKGGANATAKILALIAGIYAGADCTNDTELFAPRWHGPVVHR